MHGDLDQVSDLIPRGLSHGVFTGEDFHRQLELVAVHRVTLPFGGFQIRADHNRRSLLARERLGTAAKHPIFDQRTGVQNQRLRPLDDAFLNRRHD
ncbi:hypothetical protein D3C80_1725800 [compost metagenome]